LGGFSPPCLRDLAKRGGLREFRLSGQFLRWTNTGGGLLLVVSFPVTFFFFDSLCNGRLVFPFLGSPTLSLLSVRLRGLGVYGGCRSHSRPFLLSPPSGTARPQGLTVKKLPCSAAKPILLPPMVAARRPVLMRPTFDAIRGADRSQDLVSTPLSPSFSSLERFKRNI